MLYTALIFGLISSLHCLGMCGPIAMMLPVDQHNQVKKVLQILTYHLGRISAYTLLGFVFGLLGKGLFIAGLQQQLSIIAGILMIVFVLLPQKRLGRLNFLQPIYRVVNVVKKSLGSQFKKKSFSSLYAIGFFNGFLPCAMVYVALFGALSTQGIESGMLYMALFGVGTIPLMSSVIYIRDWFPNAWRVTVLKYFPYIIVVLGMLFIVRGLGLNIPFMSPDTLNLFIKEDPNC